MNPTRLFAVEKARENGFTLTDLLVVIVTVAILGVLLLPALAGTKPNSRAFQCLENLRQLTLGWQMYAEDNNGKLPPSGGQGTTRVPFDAADYAPGAHYSQWCPGNVVAFNIDAYNYIKAGLVWPYINKLEVYRCAADTAVLKKMGQPPQPRPRSYSMNCTINPIRPEASVAWNSAGVCCILKDTDFIRPGPSMTWVLTDENEGSLNDTLFCISPLDLNHWQDAPAARHAGSGSISFADGHTEMKRWTDKYILQVPTVFATGHGSAVDPNSTDWAWLVQRTTVLR
jgi:prepilin-type processing-associated H-X9-DG protein